MRTALVCATAMLASGCASVLAPLPSAVPPAETLFGAGTIAETPPTAPSRNPTVGAVIVPGRPQTPAPAATETPIRRGEVSLNYPGVDVQAVAKGVLGDLLGLSYTLAPDIHTPVTLAPGHPIARADVLRVFEEALRNASLALVQQGAGYAILPVDQAKAVAPLGDTTTPGFMSEAVPLRFVNADALRRLIDPVLPGVVTGADAASNVLTIAGTEGQRASARDLVRQFDVNWLRGASFALFTPRRTDSRLIVPELDKLLNADGAPTKGLVRLIAMDRINGILAVSTQPQYLEDVRRWVEILDREGESNQRRLFVYRVQNGRSSDLAKVLISAFGAGGSAPGGGRSGEPRFQDSGRFADTLGTPPTDSGQAGAGAPSAGFGAVNPATGGLGGGASNLTGTGVTTTGLGAGGMGPGGGGQEPGAAPASVDVQTEDFHAKITSDETNNAIVVFATPRDYAVVEDALRKLDVAPYQVMIEAAITEVTLTDALRFGVQGLYTNHGIAAGLTESATSATPMSAFPGFSAFYAAKTISAALNALEGLTKINVVSAPKLMVLNNQTASIEVGDQVPILTGSATNVITSNAAIVNSVDYHDTGIILKITPRVNSSGYVLLDMSQEVSDVVPNSTTSTINSPTFSTRKIATSIAVHDGEVIALGGLIQDSRNDTTSGIPGVSRIPFLGPLLFGNIQKNDTRTELVVLLRTRVVRSGDDARAVTDELREKLHGLSALLPPGRMP